MRRMLSLGPPEHRQRRSDESSGFENNARPDRLHQFEPPLSPL